MSSPLLREHSRTFSKLLCNLYFLRSMGGGPRTFPGGLNKWQWKRLHEKKAKEKERKLLDQEKQLYQARLRSQIRSKLAGRSDDQSTMDPESHSGFKPMSTKDHVKALADRFMKEGAEDLWNEADGPIKSYTRPPQPHLKNRVIESSIDSRKLISDGRNLVNCNRRSLNPSFDSLKPRHYSVKSGGRSKPKSRFRRNDDSSSSDDDEDELNSVDESKGKNGGNSRWPRFNFGEVESDEESKSRGGSSAKKMMSRATLGNYDKRKVRLVPKDLEEENDLSEQVQSIRDELKRRNSYPPEVEQRQEESLLSQKSIYFFSFDGVAKQKQLPAIEAVLKATSSKANQRVPSILVLILCPTRELASQIAAEANVMLRYHDGIGVQTLIGGTRFKVDQKRLESDPCQIIVATPGRLLDHIENKSGFSVRLMGLKMIIFDEADHLLDLGFRKDVEKIVDCVPRQRQSLLFCATIPKEVRRISQLVLKREHVFIDTVGLGCVETHSKVKQLYLVSPHELHFQIVHQILKEHISHVVDYKVIIFCTTAMVTSVMFLLLREMRMNVREMHSRKPQLYRTRISDEFRESKRLILVTSDVSSRGMNYPDVTLVIQVGIPSDREQYIHRLGRTGREGKEGEGILLLAPWEEYFLDEIKDLPIEKSPSMQLDSDMKVKVEDAMLKIDTSVKEAAYHAWLGYYNSIREIGRDKTTLVELANQFCDSIGLQKPPSLFRRTASKMGLRDIPGIRIRK